MSSKLFFALLLVAAINSHGVTTDSTSTVTGSTGTTATTTITTTTPKPSKMTMTLSGCNITNFGAHASLHGGPCSISCSLDDNGDQDYQYYSGALYYYTTDENTAVQLTSESKTIYIDHDLSDYNAGTYMCKITIRRLSSNTLETYKNSFRVDPSRSGVQLGDSCKTNQDCMALNAQCNQDGKCECAGYCNIKYNKHDDSPGCLALGTDSGVDGSSVCNVDEECQIQNLAMDVKCSKGYCIYSGHHLRLLPADIAYVTLGSVAVCLGCVAVFHSMKRKKRD